MKYHLQDAGGTTGTSVMQRAKNQPARRKKNTTTGTGEDATAANVGNKINITRNVKLVDSCENN